MAADPGGIVVELNGAFSHLFGSHLLGRPLTDLVTPSEAGAIRAREPMGATLEHVEVGSGAREVRGVRFVDLTTVASGGGSDRVVFVVPHGGESGRADAGERWARHQEMAHRATPSRTAPSNRRCCWPEPTKR